MTLLGARRRDELSLLMSLLAGTKQTSLERHQMFAISGCIQPVSATPVAVYRQGFRSPRSFAGVD